MCRFTLYHGPELVLDELLTKPAHSILDQSRHSRERREPTNGDGFGVAWYVPERSPEPALFRSTSPAWSDPNLRDLARVSASRCVMAHVRAATGDGAVSLANCHPFRHGRLAFMHNGDVGGFRRLRRPLLAQLSEPAFELVRGTTDSEHAFALFVDELGGGADAPDLAGALRRTIERLLDLARRHGEPEACYLNFAVSDGRRAAVSRFTTRPDHPGETLYLNRGRRYTCEEGVCRMVEPDEDGHAVIVSSEPLSQDPGWEAAPPSSLVAIDAEGDVVVEAL